MEGADAAALASPAPPAFSSAQAAGEMVEDYWQALTRDVPFSQYGTDPTIASIGFQNGHPAGSSAPLFWAAGQYVRLLQNIVANNILERPTDTFNRYVTHMVAQTALTVTAPADQSAVTASPVTVTGTSVPGNAIYVAATNTDQDSQTTTATTTT